MQTSYTEISGTPDQIARFTKRIRQPIDEIAAAVLEVMGLVDMPIKFDISLRGNAEDVQEHYRSQRFKQPFSAPAYCEYANIYISVADATPGMLAHELAHAVINMYFTDPIPTELHELIAQTVEAQTCKKLSRWWQF